VPGVAEAQGSAIPLLCLTTDTPVSQHHRGVLTELDQESLFRPITKWNTRINSPSTMAEMTRRAIRMATVGRPGAVHLSLPTDSLEGETDDRSVYGVPELSRVPTVRTRPDPAMVERAARVIDHATRPVIVAGGGVVTGQAWDELTRFAEMLNIPVATSINGKGSIAETSRVSIGIVGGNGARSYTNDIVADADLIVYIGSRTDSTTTHHWSVPKLTEPPAVIQIDVEPFEIGNNYKLAVPIAGDAGLTLVDLLDAIDDPTGVGTRNRKRIDGLVAIADRYWEDVRQQAQQTDVPIKPQVIVAAMRELLPDDAVIVADPGTPTPYLGAQYRLNRPGRSTIIPRAHGGLGYAIPAVVGAAKARPDAPIVGFTADGSFGMSCGELETITRLDLPIVFVHCNNSSFGWIKELQHLYHDDEYFSVDFNPVDYAGIARGFGFQATQITEPGSFKAALAHALADGRPWFIDVVTESQITETPPVAGWISAEAERAEQRSLAR
ncbi:MAG: thiamine pyrophosphate-binding protein, partial [Thermomicrobiales bacterium]|nr:thiamine pyrophosphate-binding protein [Thermomicrobiales bacterium]